MGKLKEISTVVKKILINEPQTRDNDKLLILKVWAIEDAGIRNPEYSFLSFAKCFLSDKFTDTESIRRSRQKLQEENPALRGSNYRKRHKFQREFTEQLNAIK